MIYPKCRKGQESVQKKGQLSVQKALMKAYCNRVVLKEWSPDQEQHHYLGTFQKYKFLCAFLDLLNQKL